MITRVDTDAILRRRLYLQRYVSSLFYQATVIGRPFDAMLVSLIDEFVAHADDRTLGLLAKQRPGSHEAARFLAGIKRIIQDQYVATREHLLEQMDQLVERETPILSSALSDSAPPSTRGIASMPVNGQVQSDLITGFFALYLVRIVQQVTRSAVTGPADMRPLVQGTRSEKYRDGVMYWRNNRLLRPNIDLLVNGNASNVADSVYAHYDVAWVHWLATLDYRTCPRCYAAESNGPYMAGHAPPRPMHPMCRCLLIPAVPGITTERPFVRSFDSVKDIPRGQRAGKIGTTRDTIEQFFNRMTDQEREQYMGTARADLWRRGKIDDVKQLVDQRNNQSLSLEQLPE